MIEYVKINAIQVNIPDITLNKKYSRSKSVLKVYSKRQQNLLSQYGSGEMG